MKGRARYKTFGKRRSLRLPGYDYSSPRPVHLVIGTYGKRPILTGRLAMAMVGCLKETAERCEVVLFAFCVMPDHVHLLVSSRGGVDLVTFVQRFKGKSTRIFWELGGRGKLWQRGFYDHVLRKEEAVEDVAAYVLNNPVRKGLARDFRDYHYSGSSVIEW